MAHQHQVVDSDIRFTINPTTRAIARADSKKSSLVVGDHNSERFTFEIPKTVEGHDMSLCNVVRIHYLNTSSDNKSVQSLGVYEVDDFGPDPEDNTIMKFSWLISRKATQHVGPLSFTIQFACITGFKIDYSWQSGIFSGITVSNSVNGSEVIIEEYADVLRQWWEQLYARAELPITIIPFEDFEALNGDAKNNMLYLLSNDPSVENLEKIPSIEKSIEALNVDIDSLEKEVSINENNIRSLTTTVQANGQNITNLINDVDSLEEEVETAKSTITNLTSKAQTNEQNITNITNDVTDIKQNVTRIDPIVKSNEQNIVGLNNRLISVGETVETIGQKWRRDDYTLLYVYDAGKESPWYTEVAVGLYMIKVVYTHPSTGYKTSTHVVMDARYGEIASADINLRISNIGDTKHFNIICIYDGLGNHAHFVPYGPSAVDEQCVELYGRRIYTNPIKLSTSNNDPFIVTPISEFSGENVIHRLEVQGICRVVSDEFNTSVKFIGNLHLPSISPVECKIIGASVKSNKGVLETSLGDIVIIDDISIYGNNVNISIYGSNFTMYCENILVHQGGIYLKTVPVDMNGSVTVVPITELDGEIIRHYLKIRGRYRFGDSNAYTEKDFESILNLPSSSIVNFKVTGMNIESNKGVLKTTLGDIDITGDISRDVATFGEDGDFSMIGNGVTVYCSDIPGQLG